ncbi:hypothetical protein [Salinispora arenicola]|uniref:hypothetical protein n=1 Tax=Salinispora arenicola TaxID=168697 RepID=UPI00037A9B68|nr:hypothetical protein [Salinispora arenicola]
MANPIDGRLGSLVLTDWVAPAPTGHDEAYLLLTTPDSRAFKTMPLLAQAIGLGEPGTVTATPAADTWVALGDRWVTLHTPGERFARPVDDEWTQIARARRQVVLCVGAAPMPPHMDPDTYTARHDAQIAIGLIPARAA